MAEVLLLFVIHKVMKPSVCSLWKLPSQYTRLYAGYPESCNCDAFALFLWRVSCKYANNMDQIRKNLIRGQALVGFDLFDRFYVGIKRWEGRIESLGIKKGVQS